MAATMTDSAMRRAVSKVDFVPGADQIVPDCRFGFLDPDDSLAMPLDRVTGRTMIGRPARLDCDMPIGPSQALITAGHWRNGAIVPERGEDGKM
jgi:hypothetical protein